MAVKLPPVRVSAGAWIIAATMLLLIPFHWFAAITLSALVHELWHLTALYFLRVRLCAVSIGAFGAQITTQPMTNRQEGLCALAGPVGSLSLLLLIRWLPLTAICGLLQSLYNLLPFYPLDGSRILRCFCVRLFKRPVAELICNVAHVCAVIFGFVFFLAGAVILRLGILPFFAAIVLVVTKIFLQRRRSSGTIVLPMK